MVPHPGPGPTVPAARPGLQAVIGGWDARNAAETALIDDGFERSIDWRKEVLLKFPTGRKLYAPRGKLLRAGDRLKQRALGITLRRISRNWRDFYEGKTARAIVKDMERNAGLIAAGDLSAYKPTWREPVCGAFRGHRVCSMAPPS